MIHQGQEGSRTVIRRVARALFIASFGLVAALPTLGQSRQEAFELAVARLGDASAGTAQVSISAATGMATFIRLPADVSDAVAPGDAVAEKASFFLANYGAVLGIENASEELFYVRSSVDAVLTSLTYQQVHGGVPVFAGLIRLHFDGEARLVAVNGTFLPDVAVASQPVWSAESVAAVAVAEVQEDGSESLAVTSSDLFVYRTGLAQGIPGRNHLAWRSEVVDEGGSVREFVFVDALTGKVIDRITGVHAALDREVSETTLSSIVWDESQNHPLNLPANWMLGTAQQVTDWQNEIDGAGESYNLFATMTGASYPSYDGASATMRTVNNDPQIQCPNANWNGTSANYCTGVTSDDVVSHEWAHAYTEYTSNLIYQWQPGALNESYSDIWGEVVDQLNGRGTDVPGGPRSDGGCSQYGNQIGAASIDNSYRWIMGEDSTAFGIGLRRDMWRPSCNYDPDFVSHNRYHCPATDEGGVHTNSGIPNRTFALLVDGSVAEGISAIGMTKAARIHWVAQNMLTPASGFPDHADALEASCQVLVGATLYDLNTATATPSTSTQVITQSDCAQVTTAVAVTELRTPPTCSWWSSLLAPNPPALCGGDGRRSFLHQDWESGLGSWGVGTRAVVNSGTFDTQDWAVVSSLPDNRPGAGAFVEDVYSLGDCVNDIEAGVLYLESPVVTIPAGPTPRLVFDHWVAIEKLWDGGNVKVSVNGSSFTHLSSSAFTFNAYNATLTGGGNDNPLAGQKAFSGSDTGTVQGSWGQSQVNLAGIASAGDDVQFRFELGLDGCNGLIGWYLDDVEVYSCCVAPAAGLRGWWSLDEATGPYAFDLVDSNAGLHQGGPTPTAGQVAGGLEFDGVDDYLEVPDCSNLDVGNADFSFAAWVKTTDNAGMILAKRTQTGNVYNGYLFMVHNGGLLLQIADPTSWWSNFVSGAAQVNDGDWHFVAVTVDRDQLNGGTFYVDGVAVASFNPTARQGILSNTSDLRIGRSIGGGAAQYFDGVLDEVQVFQKALTSSEITRLWHAGSAGQCKQAAIPKLPKCVESWGGN